VVVDTETTGLDVTQSRIVQIGAVRIGGNHLHDDDVFDMLVYPGEPIPAKTTAVHGITDHMVADAQRFDEIADPFIDFVGETALLGHNIGFDIAMLKREFSLIERDWTLPPVLDTIALARIINPVLPNFTLEVIASWLGLSVKNRHSALGDARMTAQIFLALIPLLRDAGIRTIADAQRASADLPQHPSAQSAYAMTIDSAAESIVSDAIGRIDSFPYQHRVRDVMSSPALIVESNVTPSQLATLLTEEEKSAAFVTLSGADAGTTGIVTERDLMRLLATDGVGTVGEMASAPLMTISKDAFVYTALGRMRGASVRHLGVSDGAGNIVGAITTGDLLRQRAQDVMTLSGDWETSTSVAELASNWGRLPLIARSLMEEGVDALHITAVLGEQLATVTRHAAVLAEQQMVNNGDGPAPAAFSVLLLGSGSRGETLLAPDQDNAIVYADGCADADAWFASYGKILSDILDQVGVPYCNGGVMASNLEWRQSLTGWKTTIQNWLKRAVWKELLNVDIFYDFQPVYGDTALANELRDYAYDLAGKTPAFVRQLSAMATSFEAPLGYFGALKTDNGRVDLKAGGTLPIVSGARVLALRYGIYERSTRSRIEGVKRLDAVNGDDLDDITAAHELLLQHILEQQLKDMAAGITPSNKVDIKHLSKRTRARLKQALETVSAIHMVLGEPLGSG
jgi:DNA polymerase-3 subunit epsilon/CBS domain-containing protein